jgi:hypothetical protein
MRICFLCPLILLGLSAPALAQPLQPSQQTTDPVLTPLPAPEGVAGDRPSDYLRAAQGALAAGRPKEAREAREMAQTRMLDRSVPLGQTDRPSDNPTIGEISQALQALDARDRAGTLRMIQAALASSTAQGL